MFTYRWTFAPTLTLIVMLTTSILPAWAQV